MKFQVNKIYTHQSIDGFIKHYLIVKRTDKTVSVQAVVNGTARGKIDRKSISVNADNDNIELIRQAGKYTNLVMLSADDSYQNYEEQLK